MVDRVKKINFLDQDGTFTVNNPENTSYLYFPIAGERGLKSAVSPNLGGDSKVNQNQFLMEPVSAENLHNNRSTRNFWVLVEGEGYWSATGNSAMQEAEKFTKNQDDSQVTAGFMWHSLTRNSKKYQIQANITSFIPVFCNVEIMQVTICNHSSEKKKLTAVAAIPIYGRSADNIRDHRHVTSLLHRIRTNQDGIVVQPTMSFDERGHRENTTMYYVCGATAEGRKPVEFYPDVMSFIGEGGSYTNPAAISCGQAGVSGGYEIDGQEAFGGIKFEEVSVKPGESVSYIVLCGVADSQEAVQDTVEKYHTKQQVDAELDRTKEYWQKLVNIRYQTGNQKQDNYLRWISFQPVLRRIYGCSFLPHHDYGRGGRGWRDLWQDCLSLLFIEPQSVRNMIFDNYGGVRVDGTNATIIGDKSGEFIADRNHISRVWMDHGFWPFLTTRLYMDQTGDLEILLQKQTYFKDSMIKRGNGKDAAWSEAYGEKQKTKHNEVYQGTLLEHILLENLGAFYDVGEHNHMRLCGADWNDALDMASLHGESVAFTSAYAGNLHDIAAYIRKLKENRGICTVLLMEEMEVLLQDDDAMYQDAEKKRNVLSEYCNRCSTTITGKQIEVNVEDLARNLDQKADWIMEYIRKTEWLEDTSSEGWYNSYYDNHKRQVEGKFHSGVRMMLTGQVFTIMSKTADSNQVKQITQTADKYLYEKRAGGYRLNTNFHEKKMDMGRMFGFAYGEKENGAVFSHMTIMYANALYQRGFVKEGYKALQTLIEAAMDFEVSKIYPGIPEYFNARGRGMYHYLTGAASWYMLTMITQVFGVRGEVGNLTIEPKLLAQQFDESGVAGIETAFAGAEIKLRIHNEERIEYGDYRIGSVHINGQEVSVTHTAGFTIEREQLKAGETYLIEVRLDRKEGKSERFF